MIIRYSDNIPKQIIGIAINNKRNITYFTLIAIVATAQYEYGKVFLWTPLELPFTTVTILGSALAIFLGFRNNSAYDRWWEARKIWGGIVNASRTWGMLITSFSSSYFESELSSEEIKIWQAKMIRRHIAWLYATKMHLRKLTNWDFLSKYLDENELEDIKKYHNKPTQLLQKQGKELQHAYELSLFDDFRHMELAKSVKEFYSLQGMAERIKGTVFPYYYNYFTIVFLWLFVLCLPLALVPVMSWGTIPMTIAIAFVFTILEKSGAITEDPFEGRAADTPMTSIIRNIEIDLLEMIQTETIPAPIEPKTGRFGVKYLD